MLTVPNSAALLVLLLLQAHVSSTTASSMLSWLFSSTNTSTSAANSLGHQHSHHVHKPHVAIVVIVTNAANSTERRHWLRTQMLRNLALLQQQTPLLAERHRVVFRFAIGTSHLPQDLLAVVSAEHQAHDDILLLDVPDTDCPDPPMSGHDSATTLKVLHSAVWAHERWRFEWFARIGDDAYFRVDYFLHHVARTLPKSRIMFGWCTALYYVFAPRDKNVSAATLPYCSGMGYIMTYDAVDHIVRSAHFLSAGYPEDAVVGSWFAGTRLEFMHDARFHDWDMQICSEHSILVHKMRTEDKWAQVDARGIITSCFPKAAPSTG